MNPMNLEQARHNMVEQQVRPWDVLDDRVLHTLNQIPRDLFVPENYRELAYADTEIPIGEGESMLAPVVEGRLLQALNIQPDDRVLEIGTGSGYTTACLAHLGQRVESVDIHQGFVDKARIKHETLGFTNIKLSVCDAVTDSMAPESYDVIAVTGAVYQVPESFKQALKPGGRLFVICGEAPVMEAMLITRTGPHEWAEEKQFETSIKYLVHGEKQPAFVF